MRVRGTPSERVTPGVGKTLSVRLSMFERLLARVCVRVCETQFGLERGCETLRLRVTVSVQDPECEGLHETP